MKIAEFVRTAGRGFGWTAPAAMACLALAQPANDLCTEAREIGLNDNLEGSNVGATSDIQASSCSGLDEKDVWFRFTAPESKRYRFEVPLDFNSTLLTPTLALFDACGGTELACDALDFFTRVDLDMDASQVVLIRIAGDVGDEGSFRLSVTETPLPPANDECAGAAPLVLDELTAQYAEITISDVSSCNPFRHDLWYTFQAPAADRYRFTATGGGAGVSMTAYADCSLATVLACDDECDPIGRVEVDMTAGQIVTLRAAACVDPGEDNPVVFYVMADAAPETPVNDECAGAIAVSAGSSTPGTSRGATADQGAMCFGGSANDLTAVWYRFASTAAQPLLYNITVVPEENFFPLMTAMDGCGGNILECAEPFGPNNEAAFNLLLAPGQEVWLRIAGTNLTEGDFTLVVGPGTPPAANDECAGAIPLTPGTTVHDSTTDATGLAGVASPCSTDDEIDIWFTLANTESSQKMYILDTVGTTGLEFPTIVVYGSCGGEVIACNYAHADIFPNARVAILLDPGDNVPVRISGALRAVGDFTLNVSLPLDPPPAPANDECPNAQVVTSVPFEVELAAGTAFDDEDIACDRFVGPSSGGIWYVLTPPTSSALWIRSEGLPELAYALYRGPSCQLLMPLACESGSQAFLLLLGGQQHRLLVARQDASFASPDDIYRFQLDYLALTNPGDACADAQTLTLPIRGFFSHAAATNEGPGDAPAGSCNVDESQSEGLSKSVYFRFTAAQSGILTGSFSPEMIEGVAAVYSGTCGNLVELGCASFARPLELSVPVTAGESYIVQYGALGSTDVGGRVAFSLQVDPTPCPGDFNGSGGVTVQDIFDFLAAYFSADPRADINGVGGVTVQDIFDFLAAYFAGC